MHQNLVYKHRITFKTKTTVSVSAHAPPSPPSAAALTPLGQVSCRYAIRGLHLAQAQQQQQVARSPEQQQYICTSKTAVWSWCTQGFYPTAWFFLLHRGKTVERPACSRWVLSDRQCGSLVARKRARTLCATPAFPASNKY